MNIIADYVKIVEFVQYAPRISVKCVFKVVNRHLQQVSKWSMFCYKLT